MFTAASDGSNAANPTPTGLTGPPAYQTTNPDTVARVAGADRFGTAVAASRMEWATAGVTGQTGLQPAKAVVLSRSDTFADALAGSTLATAKQGPLLMTPPGSLNPTTAAEIKRVLGANPEPFTFSAAPTRSRPVSPRRSRSLAGRFPTPQCACRARIVMAPQSQSRRRLVVQPGNVM